MTTRPAFRPAADLTLFLAPTCPVARFHLDVATSVEDDFEMGLIKAAIQLGGWTGRQVKRTLLGLHRAIRLYGYRVTLR